ncbi:MULTISPECIES: hypothetical protein [Nostocales]|uniref:Uncharacterized protein n=2 Tax=Nostocales TaxID=1161 RepID=A0ABW8WGT4_9CYAN|nr:hypothetical protein [Tolypothrix bouteillei]
MEEVNICKVERVVLIYSVGDAIALTTVENTNHLLQDKLNFN